jgi:hypothetical protein
MRHAIAVCLAVGWTATLLSAGAKIQAQKDPVFDFSRLKTWSWSPSGPGDVKVWLTAESKSEPVKRQYEPVIMQAVGDELTRRGLPSSAQPDFHVTYWVLLTVGSSSQQMGDFLPAVANWGLPPFAPQTTALKVYPMGTLVLDISTVVPDRVVWRAVAQAEVDLDKTDEQRATRLRAVVRDVVAKLPRKK